MLSIGIALFTYKAALDPFITVLMFSKDRGMYDAYLPFIVVTLVGGLMFHIIILVRWLNSLKVKSQKLGRPTEKNKMKYIVLLPIVFVLTGLTSMVVKNGLLGNYEIIFMAFIVTIVYLGLLIAAVEFLLAMYCIFKYPSFSVKNFN